MYLHFQLAKNINFICLLKINEIIHNYFPIIWFKNLIKCLQIKIPSELMMYNTDAKLF